LLAVTFALAFTLGVAPTADAHSTDQIPLYDGLTKLFDHVRAPDLTTFFKDESLGDTRGTPEYTSRAGLKIVRDNFNLPHIFGSTRFTPRSVPVGSQPRVAAS
jgi:hypothetical protein